MKISIITTVYKAEKDLPRLLDSMMAQKSSELEFFLIDNGSPDRSGEICKEYAKKDSRFKLFTIKDNVGYINARNIGIREVDADYIGFCDSDDYLEPRGYDYAIGKIKETACDLYITAYQTVYKQGTTINHIPYAVGLYEGENIEKQILPQAFGYFHGKPVLHGFAWKQIFRRSIFIENQLGYIQELQPYEDQILNIDFIRNSKTIYIDDIVLYNYIVNDESITAKLISDFNPAEEWKRIALFYSEKKSRVKTEGQQEALSNQMVEFLYNMFLNTSKRTNISTKDSAKEFKQCCDETLIEEMLCSVDDKISLRYKIVKMLLLKHYYKILLIIIRLGRKLRK